MCIRDRLYVMYHTDISTPKKPVKVHIPVGSGTVNGYFDVTRHTDLSLIHIFEIVFVRGDGFLAPACLAQVVGAAFVHGEEAHGGAVFRGLSLIHI